MVGSRSKRGVNKRDPMLFDGVIKVVQPLTKWVPLPAPAKRSATHEQNEGKKEEHVCRSKCVIVCMQWYTLFLKEN